MKPWLRQYSGFARNRSASWFGDRVVFEFEGYTLPLIRH